MNKRLDEKLHEIEKETRPVFYQTGNYTVCLLWSDRFDRVIHNKGFSPAIGVAKRNPSCDEDNPTRGRTIALKRAVKVLLD